MLGKIGRKIKVVFHDLNRVILYIKSYKEIKEISQLSVLSGDNTNYLASSCPICKSKDIHTFIKLPIGAPGNQNHSLLYFDYERIGADLLLKKKNILDNTLGFFLSIPWNFCNGCNNASMGISFSSGHLLEYYSKYYHRKYGYEPNRRATKELHGKYLSSLLSRKSKVLEIGAAEGFTAEFLARNGHEVSVFEPSGKFREKLRRTSNLKYSDNINTGENVFDAIYLHHVLEHIPDPIGYVRKLSTLLKKDGILLIQVPDLTSQIEILKRSMRRSIFAIFNPPYYSFDHIEYEFSKEKSFAWFDALANDHISAFTPEGITYLLSQVNLNVVELIRSTPDRVSFNPMKYAWPVDEITGSPPNGITVLARRKDSEISI